MGLNSFHSKFHLIRLGGHAIIGGNAWNELMRMDYESSMGLLSKLAELIAARATATLSVRDEMLSQLLPF